VQLVVSIGDKLIDGLAIGGKLIDTGSSNLLELGSTGQYVVKLQQMLISKGYSCGSAGADGDFGNGTYNAVIAFQQNNGLIIDGIVGPATWNSLLNLTSTTYNTSSNLELGSNGQDVVKLQSILISKGYNCGSTGADGIFGTATYNAVIAFQTDQKLVGDGIVGPATWDSLLNSNSSTRNSSYGTLQKGSNGQDVVNLQQMLIARGYNCGSSGADGDFGNGTYNAVTAFQTDQKLVVDGIVGPTTWTALYPLLKAGDKKQEVTILQQMLIAKGYNCGSSGVDGDFGNGTYNAVTAFQRDKYLETDGIVGPLTWKALIC
jgi:peptidoglycan hydrolase-like protein with peptidoglycan-binding domain